MYVYIYTSIFIYTHVFWDILELAVLALATGLCKDIHSQNVTDPSLLHSLSDLNETGLIVLEPELWHTKG